MIKSFFTSAWRSLWKNRFFSAINIFGISAGLVCCLLIGLYIAHELSYDKFQEKGDRIARVIMEYSFGGETNKGNYTSTKVAPSFKRNFPEVEAGVRMLSTSRVIRYEDKMFNEPRFLLADSTFFDVFTFPLIAGDPETALDAPDKVVLTRSAAKKYFGDSDPLGKTVQVGTDAKPFLVTGLVNDNPSNSQIRFDFVASFSSLGPAQEETYWDANYTTYLLLKDPSAFASLQKKIPPFMKKEMEGENATVNFHLEPMKSVYLHSPYSGFIPNNSITYIYIIGAVALLILAIACFTYVNLATARSMERAKEVGIRKTIGAMKKQIFWQFVGESTLVALIAMIISFIAVGLLIPAFNSLADKNLTTAQLFSPTTLGICLFFIACIGLLAGSYPALILSGFQPVRVLKGSYKNTGSGLLVRKSLIVFQFVITVFLIASTIVIKSQLHFIQNRKLGYDREHVLVMPVDQKMTGNINVIKTAFKANPAVRSISRAYDAPTKIVGGYNMSRPEMPAGQQISVRANPVDEEYIKTTGLQLIAGSDFTEQDIRDVTEHPDDSAIYHFILNESAAAKLGWSPEEAINKKMFLGDNRPGTVKGVIRDFHFESLHSPIGPLVLFPAAWSRILLVKTSGEQLPATIDYLSAQWKKTVPHRPFEYHFLDEDFNRMYSAELRLGKVLNIFTAIAILLSCLGLLGLSSYAAQQRIKEIGVRKVMGASLADIIRILSIDFIRLSLIAAVIAIPVAWWASWSWLQDFNYRITMSWWIFVLAAGIALLLTFVTVSVQALRAGLMNPVKSLRTE